MQNRFILVLLAIAIIMASLAAFYSTSERVTAQDDSGASSTMTREEIEGIIRDFIKSNPEVLVESLEEYQRKLWAQELQRRAAAVEKSQNKLTSDPDSPVAGNPEGDITIVEFFDYNCGYCKRMVNTIAALLKEDTNVKVVFKEFPILTVNLPTDYSRMAAKASLAVFRIAPEKYFDFHQAVMHMSARPTEDALLGIASGLKIDTTGLREEMKKPEIDAELKEVQDLAESLGVSGTPALVINGELTPGAITLEQLKAKIAAARNSKKSSAANDSSSTTEKAADSKDDSKEEKKK